MEPRRPAPSPPDGERPSARRVYPSGPRRWRPEVLPDTAWRLAGIGAAVVLWTAGSGLAWWQTSTTDCVRTYPPGDLRMACEHATAGGSGLAVWLAGLAGVVSAVRLTRLGPALLDAVPVASAGVADLLALRAAVRAPTPGLHLTWLGPLVVLPLLGVLTVATVQVVRAGGVSLPEMAEQARAARADRPARRLRWPRPWGWRRDEYYYPSWRRRRRRRLLLIAVVVLVGFVVVVHGCARLDSNPLPAPVPAAEPGSGGGSVDGPGGAGRPATSPSPAAPPGADLIEEARRAVATSRSVHVHADQVAGAQVTVDLELTADGRADGTITTSALEFYDVRRIGAACWVRGLPGHGVAAWVRTCAIPPAGGVPRLDVAALTDWRLMVALLPAPAGAVTAPRPVSLGLFGGNAWCVTTPDGSAVYLPTGGADPHPARVTSNRGRLGAMRVDYDRWNSPVSITPP